jgi:hypothetical protein
MSRNLSGMKNSAEGKRRFPGISDIGAAERPAGTDVVLERGPDRLRIYIPPHGVDSAGKTNGILGVLFEGAGVFMVAVNLSGTAEEPALLIFGALFVLLGLFLTYSSLKRIFGKTELLLSPQGMFLQSGLPGFLKIREASLDQLRDIVIESAGSVNEVPYYRLALICGDDKLRFGQTLDEDEREWVADTIRDFVLAADLKG